MKNTTTQYNRTRVTIPKTRKSILQGLGFAPPTQAFTKEDSRGPEYGSIQVRLLPDEEGDGNYLRHESASVTHSKDGWTAYFRDTPNLKSFLRSVS